MQMWEYGALVTARQYVDNGEWVYKSGVPPFRSVWVLVAGTTSRVLGEVYSSFQTLPGKSPEAPSRDRELTVYEALNVVGAEGWIASERGAALDNFFLRRPVVENSAAQRNA